MLVPTLCVGMHCREALPPVRDRERHLCWKSSVAMSVDAERLVSHSHAERGNELEVVDGNLA